MDKDIALGCLLVAVALVLITCLVIWSRRQIDRIAERGYGSVREITKEFNGDDDR